MKRRPRSELRELMLTAGVEVYAELEPSVGGERVNYANVFRHLEETTGVRVTYGSVHERIWDNQRDFQIDVLRRATTQLVEYSTAGAEAVAVVVIDEADLSSDAGRRDATREMSRQVGATITSALHTSSLSRLQSRIAYRFAGLPEDSSERKELQGAIEESFFAGEAQFIGTYTRLVKALGLRPRRDVFGDNLLDNTAAEAVKMLTRLGRALVDGSVIVTRAIGDEAFSLPTGPDGVLQDWTIGALGAWSMVQAIFELDGVDDPAEARL